MISVARIFRHPIKAVGAEEIARVTLEEGTTLPWDRTWAVAQEGAQLDPGWNACQRFIRGVKSPLLMAVTAEMVGAKVRLTHPERPELIVDPDTEGDALIAWLKPLNSPSRPMPERVVRSAARGMTDNADPALSILSLASLAALGERLGRRMDVRRFRGNIWLEGTAPWQEFDWVGQRIALGEAELEITERIERCKATHVDPETGTPDTDTLGALETGWGHKDFGIFGIVRKGGTVARGDTVEVL